jgi:two-component system sensor histidine kinase BaeS
VTSLRTRLFLAHLLVIIVGVGTLYLAAALVAPTFFQRHMAMMAALHPSMGPGMPPFQEIPAAAAAQLADAFRGALTESLLLAGGAALIAALAVSLLVSQQVASPIHRLAIASRRIATGHYGERVPAEGRDELGQLATSFNEMAAALEDVERRRMELIGDVAHELRTPIATIEGYVEGLLDSVVPPSERTWATLHDEAGRLRRLAEDLQQLSRAEAHQLPLTPQAVAPATIVQAAVDRLAADFLAKGLELQVQVPPGLPCVQADRDRAIQIVTNLLSNALRYTPAPGCVALTAAQAGGLIRFEVRDSGIGIAPEHLPHVFERFYRVDKSRARALGGTGVGLTIARALVEAMSGRIWAESPGPGQGATFSFELPAVPMAKP